MNLQFGHPDFLWLLALAPALAWFLWSVARRKRQMMARFINARLLARLTAGVSPGHRKIRAGLLLAAVVFLVLAAAQPQLGFAWEEARQRGLDIVVAIDTSRSMMADDIKPNRLARAKLAALDLMQQARSDRLGLVAFAGTAFLQSPLTLDEDAFRQSVNLLTTDILPQGGTAIGEAINVAQSAFRENGENHKVLIIFSDGEDHEDGALEAAARAAKEGMLIYTVGVGTPDGAELKVPDENGHVATLRDETGKPVITRLDPALLQQVAEKGKGFYLPLTGAKTVETLYERGLAPLPKTDFNSRMVKRFQERYRWPLALALILLIVEMLWPERTNMKKTIPPEKTAPGKLAGAAASAVILLWLSSGAVSASPVGQAQEQYDKGRYAASLREYKKLLEKQPEDPRLNYNAGAAAYQAGEFDEAARHFSQARNAPKDLPLQERAYYNWGNALFRLGEHETEPEKKQSDWEQAVKQYEQALNLAKLTKSTDADAQFNYDLVKQKIEELKKQQQQQKNQDNKDQKDQKDDKDQKDQKDEQKQQDQQKQDQQKQDEQQAKNDQQKQDQQSKDQQQKQQDKQKQDQQKQPGGQKPDEKKPDEEEAPKPESQEANQDGQTNGTSQATQMIYMTPEQAMQLLEAAKSEQKTLIFQPTNQPPPHPDRAFKNW